VFGGALTGSAEAADRSTVDLANRKVLRVCADPANMPFSDEKGEGFENKIANIVADELKLAVEYSYFPQAVGFVRRTLAAKACDVIIGFAQGDDLVLNTNAYYRSAYAVVYRKGNGLDGLETLEDPRLKGKRLGIIAGTPPSALFVRYGLMERAKPYHFVVDRRFESPAEDMIKDIRTGEIEAGVLWGPIGGFFATRGGEKLVVQPLIKEPPAARTRLAFRISMGVRNGEDEWKRELNRVIAKRQGDIDAALLDYGVPLLDEQDQIIAKPRTGSAATSTTVQR
jgi:quinoprotein dehydrogenase-associated probable ABC transporter substrate-binding protein